MKKNVFIFILLLSFGLKYTHAESLTTPTLKYTSKLDKSVKKCIQNSSKTVLSIVDSKESDHNPVSKKRKKRKKGLTSNFLCFSNQLHYKIIFFEIELVYASQAFYFSHPHYASRERGPPAISHS